MTTSPEPDTVEPGTPEPVVYVVDDDPELLESVSWLLESIGIDAVSIDSADAFLSRYSGDHPALVVLDVRMPRISGTRLQEILNEQLPHVAIIFVSAHGDIKMSVRTMQRGAIDFLEKPYEPQQMLEVVQAGIGTARNASSTMRSDATCSRRWIRSPHGNGRSSAWWWRACPARTSPADSG